MQIQIYLLLSLLVVCVLPLQKNVSQTLVGNFILFQPHNLKSFLAPLNSHGKVHNDLIIAQILSKYCEQSQTTHYLFAIKGIGNIELSCMANEKVESAIVLKQQLSDYEWSKKNVYFNGLESKVKFVWAKIDNEDGIFKNVDTNKMGIFQLQPSIVMPHYLQSMMESASTVVLEVDNYEEMDKIFGEWKWSQFQQKGISIDIVMILNTDLPYPALLNNKDTVINRLQLINGEITRTTIPDSQYLKGLDKGIYTLHK